MFPIQKQQQQQQRPESSLRFPNKTKSVPRGRRALNPYHSWTSGSRASATSTRSRFYVDRRRKLEIVSRVHTSTQSQEALNSWRVMSRLRFRIASAALAIALLCLGQEVAWILIRIDFFCRRFAVDLRRFTPIIFVDSSRFALWPGFFSIYGDRAVRWGQHCSRYCCGCCCRCCVHAS